MTPRVARVYSPLLEHYGQCLHGIGRHENRLSAAGLAQDVGDQATVKAPSWFEYPFLSTQRAELPEAATGCVKSTKAQKRSEGRLNSNPQPGESSRNTP